MEPVAAARSKEDPHEPLKTAGVITPDALENHRYI
jgi:hypothetical protein